MGQSNICFLFKYGSLNKWDWGAINTPILKIIEWKIVC